MPRSKQSRTEVAESAKPLLTPHVPSCTEVVAWPPSGPQPRGLDMLRRMGAR